MGPVRLNFSGSGIGVSVGVRGARISTGPRGTYVHLGAGGFRYSHRLDAPAPRPPAGRPTRPDVRLPTGPGRSVETIEPARLVESTADELLEEIQQKQAKVGLIGVVLVVAGIGFVLSLLSLAADSSPLARWGWLALGMTALAVAPWAAWRDRRARTVYIRYVLDPMGEKVQEGLERLLAALGRAHAIWAVHMEHVHGDWKRNAGAGTSVGRRPVGVGWGAPPIVKTNARIGFLEVGQTRLYFFPDRLLIFGRGGVRAAAYTDLRLESGQVRFVEDGAVPRDARTVGTTWRFVRKDGGPDLRFANNYQLPIVIYGTLDLSAPSGLRLSLQTSTDGLAAGAAELLRLIQAAVRDLETRKAIAPSQEAPPAFEEDPPPLLLPARQLVRTALDALSFRWLGGLPAWALPIAWGLIFSLPLVALIARLEGTRGGLADLVFCAAFVVAGGGAGGLAFEHLRDARARRDKESAARVSRFRSLLMNELRSRPAKGFDFAAFVGDSGLPRAEADRVADEVFRRVADRVVADGLITDAERKKLDRLAKTLGMGAARAGRLEDEVKSGRYRQAVTEALADGTVTEEEARALNALRTNLGVQDAAWTAGTIVPTD
jgi:hypothetical protein